MLPDSSTAKRHTLSYLLTVPVLLIFPGQNTLRYSNFLQYFYLFPWKCYCGTFICCGTFIKIFYHKPGQSQGLAIAKPPRCFQVCPWETSSNRKKSLLRLAIVVAWCLNGGILTIYRQANPYKLPAMNHKIWKLLQMWQYSLSLC